MCAKNPILLADINIFFLLMMYSCWLWPPHPHPTNGQVSTPSGTTFMSVANYTCDTGYYLSGRNARTCEADGLWSSAAPTCLSEWPDSKRFMITSLILLFPQLSLVGHLIIHKMVKWIPILEQLTTVRLPTPAMRGTCWMAQNNALAWLMENGLIQLHPVFVSVPDYCMMLFID